MHPDERHRVGSPEGLNPFGATMAPDFGQPAPMPGAGGPPPGMPAGPPPGQPAGPPPGAPAGGPPNWDPAAFAATAPPPTAGEHEAAQRAGAPPPAPPEPAPAPVPEAHKDTPPPQGPAPQSAGAGRDPLEVPGDAPRTIAGFLVSYEGNDLGTFWPIHQGKNVVGRKGAADGLDIEVDHPTTSSRHAVVHASARPGRLKVEDPGSTNGTFVNDNRLAKGVHQELEDGDTLRFGGYAVTVKIV